TIHHDKIIFKKYMEYISRILSDTALLLLSEFKIQHVFFQALPFILRYQTGIYYFSLKLIEIFRRTIFGSDGGDFF
ncbi:MAG: hypothetical protein NC396_09135, partial [Bacteroides sp.]|nr:hypothetical protein [Bacteroides sp.]